MSGELARKTAGTSGEKQGAQGDTFEARYPQIAAWVMDGWVEIGPTDYSSSFVRALDEEGLVWEGESRYATLDEALRALEAGIAEGCAHAARRQSGTLEPRRHKANPHKQGCWLAGPHIAKGGNAW